MQGYIENKQPSWAHAMKRSVGPGAKISLEEIYDQYGPKHGINKGREFVDWLRKVKLPDTERWNIVFNENDEATSVSPRTPSPSGAQKSTQDARNDVSESAKRNIGSELTTPMVQRTDSVHKMDVAEVVELSVRKAREVIPRVTDIKLLKYALQEADKRTGKDSLCIILRRRIKELELSRMM